MTANGAKVYDIDVEDVENIRHEDKPLLARRSLAAGQAIEKIIEFVHKQVW
jgi:hypothetical protein